MAATKFCGYPRVSLEMELKICVDVVSEILNTVGKWVPGAEGLMNRFGIYGGCYRLAWAKYDVTHNRFRITVGPVRHYLIANFFVTIGGKGMCLAISTKDICVLH